MEEDNLKIELISKDGVLNALIPIMCEFSVDIYIQEKIIDYVMKCPIAYDVEKVVSELEKKDDDCGCGKIHIWDAIDIVKNGGK